MKSKLHKLITLLLLLAFIGQVVAAPLLSCNMLSSTDMTMDMDMSSNSDMSDMSKMDCCCSDECKCPQGVCLSTVMISVETLTVDFTTEKSNNYPIINFALDFTPSSVFHPPILS